MKLRIYGNIKDTKTARPIIGANVRLFLDKKMLQQVKSIENGFFEIVAEIDDSRIESGQQLRVTIEKEGYKMQEHRVLTTEGSFNLDVTLEPLVVPTPKKSFNWLPVIMGGGIVFVLLVGGAITWMFISRAKSLRIINFSLDSSSIEVGESAMLSWDTKNASSAKIEPDIGEVELSGNVQVQPTRTMEYILIAKNEEGKMISKALTLEVSTRAADKFLDTSDTTQIKSGGLNIMGSLGIGTTTPSTELEVNGTVTAKAFSGSLNWSNIVNIPAGFADGDNVNDADADPGNEIQRLSTKGNEITLSKGGSVIAPYALNADKLDGKDASEFIKEIIGRGSSNYIGKWSGSGAITNSIIYDNGKVGIGTSNPAQMLDVRGNIFVHSDTPVIRAVDTGEKNKYIELRYEGGLGRIYTDGSNIYTNRLFRADGGFQVDDKQVIDADGGWHRSHGNTGWYNNTYGGGWYMTDSSWIRSYGRKNIYHDTGILRTDGTLQVGDKGKTLNVSKDGNLAYRSNILFANTKGNVGIGTASPSAKLAVVTSDNSRQFTVGSGWADMSSSGGGQAVFGSNVYRGQQSNDFRYANNHKSIGAAGMAVNYPAWGGLSFFAHSGATTANNVFTPKTHMVIQGNGNVGIGTAKPTARLDVNGDISQPSGGWKKLGQDRYTFSKVWRGNISSTINIGSPFSHTRDKIWTGTITVAARTGGKPWDIQYFYYANFWGHTIHGNGWKLAPIIPIDSDSFRRLSIRMERPNDRSNTMNIILPYRKIQRLHIHVDMYVSESY